MSVPTSCRDVVLLDGRSEIRSLVKAQLYRDYPPVALDEIEVKWAEAREMAARSGQAFGLAPLEHAHWDWRMKAESVEAGKHLLVAIECGGEPQGVMAILQSPQPSRLFDGYLVYVDYVETAPWNLKGTDTRPRFLGIGTLLISEAIRISLEAGLGGAVGLHSLPQAEVFYKKCGMEYGGNDPHYFDLSYYEFSRVAATSWLTKIGGAP